MTHLSDASYVHRFFGAIFFIIVELVFIYRRDKFRSWDFRKSVKIKGVSVFLMIFSQLLMIIYDGLASYVKYQEGFALVYGTVLPTPFASYTAEDQLMTDVANTLLNISWSLKSSAMFLALAVWNYAVCKLMDFQNFQKSIEFKSYLFYSVVSFCLYPTLMVVFKNDPLYSTVAPQLVYNMECFIVVAIIIRTNRKFIKFCDGMTTSPTYERILSYVMINRLLIATVLADGLSLTVLNVDIMSNPQNAQARSIYNNKFATDILTAVFSAGFMLTYPIIITNMHPITRSDSDKNQKLGASRPRFVMGSSSMFYKTSQPLNLTTSLAFHGKSSHIPPIEERQLLDEGGAYIDNKKSRTRSFHEPFLDKTKDKEKQTEKEKEKEKE
jgi:hypothetical protein